MNRRISCSLALLVLLGTGLEMRIHAQEGLSQKVAGEGSALSVVQWVKPKTSGVLKGDIYAPVLGGAAAVVGDAVVVLRGKNGWVGKGETNRLGRFTVTDVEPGAYSMMVKAPGLFAFYAIQVAADNDVDVNTYPERVRVSCAFIEGAAVERLAKHVKGETSIDDVKVAPEGLDTVQSGTAAGSVVTLSDGKFSGIIHEPGTDFNPAAGMEITLIQDGLKVATGLTDEKGQFEMGGLDSGIYAMVATGKSGVVVVGIEARSVQIKDGQAKGETTSVNRFVSLLPQVESGGFSIQAGANTLGDSDDPPQEPMQDIAGTGGGGGGGGGGVGGGGVAAALLAAAAAGAAIDDGGGGVIASPAIVAE